MIRRQQWLESMRGVEKEYFVARSAVRLLLDQLRANPAWGVAEGWRARDAQKLQENLEATFVIRIYAEFESGLRQAWRRHFRRRTHPPMRDLLIAIGAPNVPVDWLADADEVRLYRNRLVHEHGDADSADIPISDVKTRLCRFFSRLPEDW